MIGQHSSDPCEQYGHIWVCGLYNTRCSTCGAVKSA